MCKDPINKKRPPSQIPAIRTLTYFLGGHGSTHNTRGKKWDNLTHLDGCEGGGKITAADS